MLGQLQELYPSAAHPFPDISECDLPPATRLEADSIVSALLRMNTWTAPGLDLMPVRHMRSVLDDSPATLPGDTGREALLGFVQRFADGRLSRAVISLLGAASLLALPAGHDKIRPIAIGTVLCRLVSVVLLRNSTPTACAYLSSQQVCCGVKSGCDVIIHDARAFLDLTWTG